MSDYLYAIIPYNSGLRFKKDAEDKFVSRMPKELKGYDIEFEKDLYWMFSNFILINTCWRMSSLTCDENGRCDVRSAIYIVAKILNAKEAWYVEELCTDEMMKPDFKFDDWKRSLKEEKAYCTKEVTLDMLRSGHWASYCHDGFSDIVIDQKYLSNVLENRQFFYDKAGIVFHGVFTSDPYPGEDWAGNGKQRYYMDMDCYDCVSADEQSPITIETLEKAIPDIDWRHGHSSQLLSEEDADKIGELWNSLIYSV